MAEFDIDAAMEAHLEGVRRAQAEEAAREPEPLPRLDVSAHRAQMELAIYERWMSTVCPDCAGAPTLFFEGAKGGVDDRRGQTFAAVVALLRGLGRPLIEVYIELGRPLLLSRVAGAFQAPWGRLEWDLWVEREAMGLPHFTPRTDGRSRTVEDVETGQRWASARELAQVLGDAPVQTLYAHLQGRPGYETFRGRRYRYAAPEHNPADSSAWSEAEKEDFRATAAAYGFTSRI